MKKRTEVVRLTKNEFNIIEIIRLNSKEFISILSKGIALIELEMWDLEDLSLRETEFKNHNLKKLEEIKLGLGLLNEIYDFIDYE